MLARALVPSVHTTSIALRSSPRLTSLPYAARQTLRHPRTMATATANRTNLTLNTGATVPALGFGTWQDKDSQEDAVYEALKAGYRHIDTARIYGTEPAVARGIKKSGVPRSEIFITTKLWNNMHHPDDVERALDASLKDLDTDYVDLFLMHWPSPSLPPDGHPYPNNEDGSPKKGDTDYVETYKAMEACQRAGKARAIGVSNFSHAEMERLLANATIVPAAHQLELHPYLQQNAFTAWHAKHGIVITQYSPFGNQNEIYSSGKNMGKLMDDPVLVEIGKKYNKSGAQVALAWGIAKGHSVIPKSKTPSRIRSNLEGDFKLSYDEIKKIEGIDKKVRFNDPSKSFGWNFYADLDGKQS